MIFYLVRHAEFSAKSAGYEDYETNAMAPLSDFGRTEAKALGALLKSKGIDRIYYSPFVRARETAEIIHQATGAPAVELAELVEHKIIPDVKERQAYKVLRDAMRADHAHAPNGSESFADAALRMRGVLEELATSGERICIIAHALLLQATLTKLFSLDKVPNLSTASITTVAYEQGNFRLLRLNERPMSIPLIFAKIRRKVRL